jgi:hypothetical protein
MVQQFGKILQQGFQKLAKYYSSPAFKDLLIHTLKGYLVMNHTYIEKQVETTVKQMWISIKSTKISIKFGEKEVIFAEQTTTYTIGNIQNSNVFQGKNIVYTSKYELHFHLYGNKTENIENIREILKNLNEKGSMLDKSRLEIDDDEEKIHNTIYVHGEDIHETTYLKLKIIPKQKQRHL